MHHAKNAFLALSVLTVWGCEPSPDSLVDSLYPPHSAVIGVQSPAETSSDERCGCGEDCSGDSEEDTGMFYVGDDEELDRDFEENGDPEYVGDDVEWDTGLAVAEFVDTGEVY